MKRIAVVIVFIIMLLIILITTTTLISLQDEVAVLQNQIVGLEEYVEVLDDLQSKINFMINPRIVTKLGVSDVRVDPYRLYIDGFVSNCGYETAYHCSLKVTLFRNNVFVKEASIDLFSLENGEFVKVSEDIHYNGDQLTHWTITPLFD